MAFFSIAIAASPSVLVSRQNNEFARITMSQAPRSSGERLCERIPSASKYHKLARRSFSETGSAVVIICVGFRDAWRAAYFLALPAMPPVSLKNHFSLSGRWRQPNANFKAWLHLLFVRLSSATADPSINILIGWELLGAIESTNAFVWQFGALLFSLFASSEIPDRPDNRRRGHRMRRSDV